MQQSCHANFQPPKALLTPIDPACLFNTTRTWHIAVFTIEYVIINLSVPFSCYLLQHSKGRSKRSTPDNNQALMTAIICAWLNSPPNCAPEPSKVLATLEAEFRVFWGIVEWIQPTSYERTLFRIVPILSIYSFLMRKLELSAPSIKAVNTLICNLA